ncbi:MAG: SDR family NAD(P)-dependent oxidoreductase [Acidimicrobiales bacterium]
MEDLAGRTAVVTGAASGIGRALAAELLAAGCSVVMADVDAASLAGAAAELADGGRPVVPVVCDVASAEDVEALRTATSAAFGPAHLVCLNAGVSPSGPVLATSESTWRWLVGVNLFGVVHGLATFGPEMAARREGHFVVTASATGLVPTPGLGPYSAVKHAVVALADVTRQELEGTGVGVSVLCPGVVRTGIAGSERHRPASLAGPSHADPQLAARYREAVEASAVGPDLVAKAALAAVVEGRFLVFPTTEVLGMVRAQADAVRAAVDERAAVENDSRASARGRMR